MGEASRQRIEEDDRRASRDAATAIALDGIEKRFGSVHAVRGATLAVAEGAVHAVVGENGAGKSTLLRIAAGVAEPDQGSIRVFGEVQRRYDARRAQELGVAMVQQHFALFPEMTVLENLALGATLERGDWHAVARRRAEQVFAEAGMALVLERKVGSLGVGERQRLEIARALFRRARVLILDEPTAVLTPQEATSLYETMKRLARAGKTVVVVTHRLDEVEEHADVVTVMRRGETIETRAVERGGEVERLSAKLLGGDPLPAPERPAREIGPAKLSVAGVSWGRLADVSLDVRGGEVVGVAGVEGNGQTEFVRAIAELGGGILGIAPGARGRVVAGRLSIVHEDRQHDGLLLGASVRDNLVLGELHLHTRAGIVDLASVTATAQARMDRFDVQPRDLGLKARALSGGNQQKIVVARALGQAPDALVVAHPTRGVDLGAARAIHEAILAAAARGVAVLVVSAELAELRLLADRIFVMSRGKLSGPFARDADDDVLGAAMLGGGEN